MRRLFRLFVPFGVLALLAFPPTAAAVHGPDKHSANTQLLFNSPNATGAVNSDIAFWGDRAYHGNYDGFRIFDISNPAAPQLLSDFRCFGPQNDPVVWENRLLFLAIDRTLTGPQCGATATAHGDPNGWEGVRIFDVSNPAAPRFITGVYTDCGAHTITLHPAGANLHLYVSSYPLRPGPTCGPVNGPRVGRDPLHGVIQVLEVPVNNPVATREIAEPRITYPGDPDNRFSPPEHGFPVTPDLLAALRACHDIAVYVPLNLAAAACAEQSQLWRIGPNGIPDTENPIWVFDDTADTDGAGGGDVVVDFHHSATFSWDGKYINFIDESFGSGCPTETPIGFTNPVMSDTGRMFFLNRAGTQLSRFQIPRPENPPGDTPNYCSAHLGNVATTIGRYLLANAWYTGGIDVVEFTNPASPFELGFYDIATTATDVGGDNWSAYHYENTTGDDDGLWIHGTHGVENPTRGRGAQVFRTAANIMDVGLRRLNPQTQEDVFRCQVRVSPSRLRARESTPVTATVTIRPGTAVLPGQRVSDVRVRLRGRGVSVTTTTNRSGVARVRGIAPTRRGTLSVSVPSVPNMLGCQARARIVSARAGVGAALTGRR